MAVQAAPNGKSAAAAKSKNAKRRAKRKDERAASEAPSEVESVSSISSSTLAAPPSLDLSEPIEIPQDSAFSSVLAAFRTTDSSDLTDGAPQKGEVIYSDDDQLSDSEGEADEAGGVAMSKRKQRKLQRLTVAELKQLVAKPELVEGADVTAADPRLLVQLKSTRNSIPVPPHWSQKRAYLQNKRGIEKPPYLLPAYIAATGIAEMKDALKEKEADATLKAKTRERVQPKMGKVEIDYQKLHDAFFKFQTRPDALTRYGETYYEGKEFETKFKERRPGDLSEELKEALSIPPLAPPPWLIAMQRFGPPPSYPHLRIAGLNAPIPEGAQWGFHPGGWGRPPMDEWGRPLFGDVMGAEESKAQQAALEALGEAPQREAWGQLEPEEEDEEEEEEEEEEETPADGLETPAPSFDQAGLETPSGRESVTSTVAGGLETPDFLELRKGGRAASTRDSTAEPHAYNAQQQPRSLYTVVQETHTSGGSGFFQSERGYDLAGAGVARNAGATQVLGEERGTKRKAAAVELSIDAEELANMSEEQLQRRYDEQRRASAKGPGAVAGSGASDPELAMYREELARKRAGKGGRGDGVKF